MADPYLGEIRIFGGNFAPSGWALCNGQLLSIQQNTALFSLLGTTYGGNGTSNFALPNLQALVPMHWGSGAGLTPRTIGETSGAPSVTLTSVDTPAHNHAWNCGQGSKGETNVVTNQVNCDEAAGTTAIYATTTDGTAMSAGTLVPQGGSQPHENMQPYLALTFIIALRGVFPPRG